MSGIILNKKCTKCGKIFPATAKYFHKSKNNKNGLKARCKQCLKKYYKENRDRIIKQSRKYFLKKKYGITLKDYNKILKSQEGMCAICKKHKDKENKALAIDHNHKTKFVRGILCNYCNSMLLRHLRDNKMRTIGLIKYLAQALEHDKNWEE